MISTKQSIFATLLLTVTSLVSIAQADVRLPSIISDNMVLQKSAKVPIWGWADAGEAITVKLNDRTATATAGEKGKWMVFLDLSASEKGPFELTVSGANTLVVKNVLVGQVWLASGQSNMEVPLGTAVPAQAAIATANFPEIRQYTTLHNTAYRPDLDYKESSARWVICSPETAVNFSAVGFFFAREIHQQVGGPVGIINSSWGGTRAEDWTSAEALGELPDFKKAMDALRPLAEKTTDADLEKTREAHALWVKTAFPADVPDAELTRDWANADFDDSDWKTMRLPGAVEQRGLKDFEGSIWFRKEFTLTAEQAGQDLTIPFGTIDDFDTTYINGQLLAKNDTDLEWSWFTFRVYTIPAKLLRAGRNVIAIRVFDRDETGGIGVWSTKESLKVYAGSEPLFSIAGDWKYKIEKQLPAVDHEKVWATDPRPRPGPALIYNGRIAPIMPYAIAGVIWYQGESNDGQAYQYRYLFPAMITDWRTQWKRAGGQETIPFLFVQLHNFICQYDEPDDAAGWAVVRESQQAALKLPDTGTVQAIDTGDNPHNIHPRNKLDVGHRLALVALAKVYGKDIEYSGPLFETMKIEGNQVIINFTHATGLHAGRFQPEEKVKGFAICGADHKFVLADAVIDGQKVIISSQRVPEPIAVRYAWVNNPATNLYNEAGLPASPFRTDAFRVVTQPEEAASSAATQPAATQP